MSYKLRFKKYIAAGVASVVATLGFAAPALAAAFSNGSFETGADPGSFTQLNATDSASIPGWTVSLGNLDYIGSYWTASNGVRSLDLNGTDAGQIQQTFDTVAGHTYLVAFDMAGNPDGGPTTKTMTVSVGGPATPYSFDTTGMTKSSMGWQTMTYWFTAAGPSTTLSFTSTTPGSAYGPALDNVVLTDVLTNKSQCMNNGWQAYTNPSFKNQGQCIAYLNGNKNTIKINTKNNVTVNNNNSQTSTSGNAHVTNNTTGGSATSGGSSNSNSSTTTITISNNPQF